MSELCAFFGANADKVKQILQLWNAYADLYNACCDDRIEDSNSYREERAFRLPCSTQGRPPQPWSEVVRRTGRHGQNACWRRLENENHHVCLHGCSAVALLLLQDMLTSILDSRDLSPQPSVDSHL